MKVALLAATLASASAFVPQSAPKFGSSLSLKQDFLEYSPYHDHSAVKVNTFKNKVRARYYTRGWLLIIGRRCE